MGEELTTDHKPNAVYSKLSDIRSNPFPTSYELPLRKVEEENVVLIPNPGISKRKLPLPEGFQSMMEIVAPLLFAAALGPTPLAE